MDMNFGGDTIQPPTGESAIPPAGPADAAVTTPSTQADVRAWLRWWEGGPGASLS